MDGKDYALIGLGILVVAGGLYLVTRPPQTPSIPTTAPDQGSAERTAALNTATAGVGLVRDIVSAFRSNQMTADKQAVYNGAK